MSDSLGKIEFFDLQQDLERADAVMNAAEVHGLVCALLCVLPVPQLDQCIPHLFDEDVDLQDANVQWVLRRVAQLAGQVTQQLQDSQFGFQLLLPDESEPLSDRAAGLAGWSQAFLFGLGLAGVEQAQVESEEIREVLSDLVQFSNLDSAAVSETDGAENDLTELEEYLRVAVLLCYTELQTAIPGQA